MAGTDLISRQDAIDAISTWDKFGVDERNRVVRWHEGLEPYVKLRDVVWAIENHPSADTCENASEITRKSNATDLISREDAIDAIEHYIDEVRNIPMGTSFKAGVKDGYYRTISIIKRLPSAERKGKWVNNIHDMPICSECGYMTPYDRAIDDYEYGNYCPNCGARMEGEEE